MSLPSSIQTLNVKPLFVARAIPWEILKSRLSLLFEIIFLSLIGISFTLALNEFSVKFLASPRITSITPRPGLTRHDQPTPLKIEFSNPVDFKMLNAAISPNIEGSWQAKKSFTANEYQFLPKTALDPATVYTVTLSGVKSKLGWEKPHSYSFQFATTPLVEINQIIPVDGSQETHVNDSIKIEFNQLIDKKSAEANFTIQPPIVGQFSWQDTTLYFKPSVDLEYNKNYQVFILPGVQNSLGLKSQQTYTSTFKTAELNETVKLSVPSYSQKYVLSCEFADMRMALAYRGINVSEEQLMAITPFDKSVRDGDTWGDPNVTFVGDVNGIWLGSGYGAYLPVIEKVMSNYRTVEGKVGWNLQGLASELKAGNPVMIWGCTSCEKPTSWHTKEGKKIYAYVHYHTFLVVGYKGNIENPTHFIVHDSRPGKGETVLTKDEFAKKWAAFNNTGLIVR